jgi:hypothetical protein
LGLGLGLGVGVGVRVRVKGVHVRLGDGPKDGEEEGVAGTRAEGVPG